MNERKKYCREDWKREKRINGEERKTKVSLETKKFGYGRPRLLFRWVTT